MKKIVLAGGCFWGVEEFYRRIKGIVNTKVGYVNGNIENPTYEEVCSGEYEFREGVLITYDESVISLSKLLELLFRIIDPTSVDQQGEDKGISYRVGAYFESDEDYHIISEYINKVKDNYTEKIVFENIKLGSFYDAELYHQQYLAKNINGYCHVNFNVINKDELK